MSDKKIGIAFLGAGTIGSAAIAETLRVASSEGLTVRGVLVRDTGKKRAFDVPYTADFSTLINDPEVKIIVSLLGDEATESRYILEALGKGKFVVTANKEVIAKRMPELFSAARKHGAGLLCEAAVAGGIQIVDNLLNRYSHNVFSSFTGIVNGTTNHMLTEMAGGKDYPTALSEAQEAGYAEPDPTNDVEGYDACYKLSIIASLTFKHYISPDHIHVEGITRLGAGDFEYARRLGYVIKLIATARRVDDALELWVAPALARTDHPLAKVNGSLNGLTFQGLPIGSFTLQGRGAGAGPTASAVLSDILSARDYILNGSLPRTVVLSDHLAVRAFDRVRNRHFIRMIMSEQPGNLSRVSGILGSHDISIRAVEQAEDKTDGKTGECVFTTYESEEGSVRSAVQEINYLGTQAQVQSVLRIVPD